MYRYIVTLQDRPTLLWIEGRWVMERYTSHKSAGRESVAHCKLTTRNKTYNFVHNVSKLCDKCYKLLNESVLSGIGLRHSDSDKGDAAAANKRINYNGRAGNGDDGSKRIVSRGKLNIIRVNINIRFTRNLLQLSRAMIHQDWKKTICALTHYRTD